MIELRSFRAEDCGAVAEAHVNYLKTPFQSDAGIQLLRVYYEVITEQKGGIGFVALNDNEFAGFVCGIWDPNLIKATLLRRWHRLAPHGVRQSLQSPVASLGLLRRVIKPHAVNLNKLQGYELRPIVVLPQHRGQSIADRLILCLLGDARERGFDQVFLFAELDNLPATRFYTKFGFQSERQVNIGGSQVRLFRYFLSTDHPQ